MRFQTLSAFLVRKPSVWEIYLCWIHCARCSLLFKTSDAGAPKNTELIQRGAPAEG